jgi:hypothetical protein
MNWQIQLAGVADTSVDADVFDIEMFDNPPSVYAALTDKIVICYFSAGSFEDWRDDAGDFPAAALGEPLDGWPGEYWLDITNDTVRDLMAARMDYAVSRGCDGVDPDNVDGYTQRSGFDLSAADQLDYNRFLADAAHERGLLVGLKNDVEQVDDLVESFDFQVNESCAEYDECGTLKPFTAAGKPVFHIEYVDDWADAEAQADAVCGVGPDLDTLIKNWDLDERRLRCP